VISLWEILGSAAVIDTIRSQIFVHKFVV
jgi:hypothetical protein